MVPGEEDNHRRREREAPRRAHAAERRVEQEPGRHSETMLNANSERQRGPDVAEAAQEDRVAGGRDVVREQCGMGVLIRVDSGVAQGVAVVVDEHRSGVGDHQGDPDRHREHPEHGERPIDLHGDGC